MRVLIAEDDTDTADLYKAALEPRGNEVTISSDGETFLKAYSVGRFDVVILDQKMPLVEGIQVAKEILSSDPSE